MSLIETMYKRRNGEERQRTTERDKFDFDVEIKGPTQKLDTRLYANILKKQSAFSRIYLVEDEFIYYTIVYNEKKEPIKTSQLEEMLGMDYELEEGEGSVLYRYIPVGKKKRASVPLQIGGPRPDRGPTSQFAGNEVFAGTGNSNRLLVVTVEAMETRINDIRNMFITQNKKLESRIEALEARIRQLEGDS